MPLAIEDGPVLEVRQSISAVRLYSRLLDRELWLAADDQVARDLAVEFPGIPVITFSEIPLLKGKSPEALAAIMEVKADFVGARLRS